MKTRQKNYEMNQIKKFNFSKRGLFSLLLIIMLVVQYIPQMLASEDKVVSLEVTVDKDAVLVGESFTYTIKYSYSSNNVNFNNEKIKAVLPMGMSYSASVGSGDVESVATTTENGNPVVEFTMKQNIPAGTTGYVTFTALYPIASLDGPTSGTINVTGGNGTDTAIDPVDPTVNVTLHNNFSWTVVKSRTNPSASINPVVDSQVTYRVLVAGNTGVGGFNIKNVVVTDTLPAEAIYVSSNPAVTSISDRTLTWDVGTINAGTTKEFFVTVSYPSPSVIANQTVRNNVSVTGNKVLDDPTSSNTISSFVDVTFSNPSPGLNNSVKKYSRGYDANTADTADEYSKDQTISYTLRNIGNAGNVPLESITVYDLVPDGIDIETAQTHGALL